MIKLKNLLSEGHSISFSKEEMAKLHKDGQIDKDGHTYIYKEVCFFLSAFKIDKIIKIKKGMQNKFTAFQLVIEINIPANKLAIAIEEKTSKSLNPWALNFSSGL